MNVDITIAPAPESIRKDSGKPNLLRAVWHDSPHGEFQFVQATSLSPVDLYRDDLVRIVEGQVRTSYNLRSIPTKEPSND